MWALTEAAAFCAKLDRFMQPTGFAIGLTGSVLTKGRSRKDLDLIVYPMHSQYVDLKFLHEQLRAFGLKSQLSAAEVRKLWLAKGSIDTKHVEVWRHGTRRIDIFILT